MRTRARSSACGARSATSPPTIRLQLPQLALETVVLGVGDLRAVEDVVEVLVAAHLAPQLLDAVFSLFAGQ